METTKVQLGTTVNYRPFGRIDYFNHENHEKIEGFFNTLGIFFYSMQREALFTKPVVAITQRIKT